MSGPPGLVVVAVELVVVVMVKLVVVVVVMGFCCGGFIKLGGETCRVVASHSVIKLSRSASVSTTTCIKII